MKWTFLKKKKFIIPAVIVLIIVGLWYRSYRISHAPVQYDTITVSRGDLKQTVEATGNVQSVDDLSLRFDIPGTVDKINVKDGDKVVSGAILATLRLAELNAAVAQAKANLDLKKAGATLQDISYYQAAVNAAEASLSQAKIDTMSAISSAEAAAATAQNNLKLAEGGENSQIVIDVYNNAAALSQSSLTTIDNGLTQADNILGVDNIFANQDFKQYLSAANPSVLNNATNYYLTAKTARNEARATASLINSLSQHTDVDSALLVEEDALTKIGQLLSGVSDVLHNTSPSQGLTQASLDAKKTTIESTRAAVSLGLTAVINQIQAINNAKNSYNTYAIAFNKAARDLESARASAQNSVNIKQAQYDQAVANLQSKTNPPRPVDIASYQAALAQAVANRDKAIIKAPIDGVISKVNFKKGESVSSMDTMIKIIMPHFEIKVDVPETDIPKLSNNDTTTITLDAFGDDVKFSGKVANIEPGSTVIQDVVYYKVTVLLDDNNQSIQSGMTANIIFNTDNRSNVIFVPLRAVRTNGEKYVRLLVGGKEKNTPVQLGMKGDNGKVEILSGLKEGDVVILGTKQ